MTALVSTSFRLAGKPGLFLSRFPEKLFIILFFIFLFEVKESQVQPSTEFCARVLIG